MYPIDHHVCGRRCCRSLFLNNNQLSGGLPLEWGQRGAFPSLELLFLGDNAFTGAHTYLPLVGLAGRLCCLATCAACRLSTIQSLQ